MIFLSHAPELEENSDIVCLFVHGTLRYWNGRECRNLTGTLDRFKTVFDNYARIFSFIKTGNWAVYFRCMPIENGTNDDISAEKVSFAAEHLMNETIDYAVITNDITVSRMRRRDDIQLVMFSVDQYIW